jgi:antitoxin ParD1/3/4
MNISLKPEYEQLIQSQIASGRFGSVDEVLGYAFQLLENDHEFDDVWLAETKQKIEVGLAQIEKGQITEGAIVIDRLKAKVQQAREAQS